MPLVTAMPITIPHFTKYHGDSTLDSDQLSITVSTNKKSYYPRETVGIERNLTRDSSTISDGLVTIEVRDPSALSISFRTKPTGNVNLTD